ncbi:MAG TPA: calcium-binding protein [Phenylobacterium sp.]|uniref:calcium-binding protein n=1 Tax=Phenylobacterium sp. TaxID=1871053 RepID=UPI002CD1F1EA|nr:calcium-binding protein [Phenylobacterium sp.]HXA37645.1 calcium-binding protein [Phenylobacterium sp.]
MTVFTFETMTALQALTFTPNDRLVFGTGTAVQSTVTYLGNGDIEIAVGTHSAEFNVSVSATGSFFSFQSDNSALWVGAPERDGVQFGDQIPPSAAFGGGGNDAMALGAHGGLLQGNQGDDSLQSGGQATIYGGQGNDTIITTSGAHDDFLQGNRGDDSFQSGGLRDTVLGGQGDDTIVGANAGAGYLDGNLGNDSLTGHGQLFGEDGNDYLKGIGAGGSSLDGGAGNDVLIGPNATSGDTFSGGDGNDGIVISDGRNFVDGGTGNDTISSDSTLAETIHGGSGDDSIFAELGGGKTIFGEDGDDDIQLLNGSGSSVDGGSGNDTIGGGTGANSISGGDGDDLLSGGAGVHLDGGAGNDTLEGGYNGQMFLTGGSGADVFVVTFAFLNSGAPSAPADGQIAQVSDWSHEDRISVTGLLPSQINYQEIAAPTFAAALNLVGAPSPNHVVAIQVGSDVVIFGDVLPPRGPEHLGAIELLGRNLTDIDASNIVG